MFQRRYAFFLYIKFLCGRAFNPTSTYLISRSRKRTWWKFWLRFKGPWLFASCWDQWDKGFLWPLVSSPPYLPVTTITGSWRAQTSPDDWWNMIVRNVAEAVDDNEEKAEVRKFSAAHENHWYPCWSYLVWYWLQLVIWLVDRWHQGEHQDSGLCRHDADKLQYHKARTVDHAHVLPAEVIWLQLWH